MRAVNLTFLLFAFFMALASLAHHLGAQIFGCPTCSLVKTESFSGLLAFGGPPALALLLAATYFRWKFSPILMAGAFVVSLGLVGWMLSTNKICELCMLVHTGVLAAGLAAIPRREAALVSIVLFSGSIGFAGSGGWERYLAPILRRTYFTPRSREAALPADKKVYVIFSSPDCGSCQQLEGLLSKVPAGTPIVHRWYLLARGRYRTLPAAVLTEVLLDKDPTFGEKFRQQLYAPLADLKPDSLIKMAGPYRKLAEETLKNPPEEVLARLAEDETAATAGLKVDRLPMLAVADPAGPVETTGGIRLMHWEPVSKLPTQGN